MTTVKSLFTLEFKSIATGYKLAASATEKFGLKSVEVFCQAPGKLVCLFETDGSAKEDLEKHARSLRKFLIDWSLVGNQQILLNAFYGQAKPSPTDSVFIVETNSLSSILTIADILVSELKAEIIEIDSGRGYGGRCVMFVSISPDDIIKAKRLLKKKKSKMVVGAEALSPIPLEFKNHWNLSDL